MKTWQQGIREHLKACKLPRGICEEVVVELAGHLEEIEEEARSRGMSEAAAVELALQEVEDWSVLAAEIGRAQSQEDFMNHRTKSLWLPALTTFVGASVSLMLTQMLGMQPRVVWIGDMGIPFYWPWLATLPIFGALGAHLTRRVQGPAGARLAAGLSPALIMLIVMCLILPWGLAIDGFHFFTLVGFGLGLITWVTIPGIALLAGAVPFLIGRPGCGSVSS